MFVHRDMQYPDPARTDRDTSSRSQERFVRIPRPTRRRTYSAHRTRRGRICSADLDAQLCSPGDASPQSSGDECDAFLRRGGDSTKAAGLRPPLPVSSARRALPTNHLVQSASRLWAAKRVFHPQDRDISSSRSCLTRGDRTWP
jgi:hypothetical protein